MHKTKSSFTRLSQNKVLLCIASRMTLSPLPFHLGIVSFYIKLYIIFIKMFQMMYFLDKIFESGLENHLVNVTLGKPFSF